jgi:hypothetical protein
MMNTEPTETPAQPQEEKPKRHYTRKEQMESGNQAILSVLGANSEAAMTKQQIITKLSEEDKKLVLPNWNLRIQLLEETGEVDSVGKKAMKKYYRSQENN